MADHAAILAENLESLGLRDGATTITLEPQTGWRVEWASPFPVLSIEGEPEQWLTLGSRRAPLDEARTLLAELHRGDSWPPLIVLLGAGLGYAVDVIETEMPTSRVLLIEPFAAAAAAMLARRDWRTMAEAGRLRVLVGPTFDGASEAWRMFDTAHEPLIVPHPVLARVRPDAIAAARRLADRAMFDAKGNAEARETLGGRYLVNTLRNLPRIVRAPHLRTWSGRGAGRPAVVCGAGPSLNRNLRELAPYRNRVVLIAVDTALRPVLEAGLEPDLVVALDPAPLNARHLSGLTLSPATWLVTEAALDPSAFDSFGERIAFFRVGDNDPWPWLTPHGLDVPVLAAWGSVLTSAFALAEWLDARPLMLMGADLSYPGNQPYCRGTMFEADWARVVLEGQVLAEHWQRHIARRATGPQAAIGGDFVESAPHLVAFRDWLADRARKAQRRVINLTGAGILVGDAIEQGSATMLTDYAVAPPIAFGAGAAAAAPLTVRLVELFEDLRDDRPPLSTWVESYQRSLDRGMLDLALEHVAESLSGRTATSAQDASVQPDDSQASPSAEAGARQARGLIALPEAVATLRAGRDGHAAPDWAAGSAAWNLRDVPLAVHPLAALLRRHRLGVLEAEGPSRSRIAGPLGLLYRLEWPQPVFESVAALLIEAAARLRAAAGSGGRAPGFVAPAAGASADSSVDDRAAERQGRTLIASTWVSGVLARERLPLWRTALDALAAIEGASDAPLPAAEPHLCVTLRLEGRRASRPWRIAAAVSHARLVEVLRGVVLGAPARRPHLERTADGVCLELSWRPLDLEEDVLTRTGVDVTSYRVLTDNGLPACLIATSTPDGEVVATPRGQLASYRVNPQGAFARLEPWPSPIVGEAHGLAGQMAWTFTTPPALLFRRTASDAVVQATVPFQTYTAAWWRDAVVLTSDSGVWSWRPGRAPELLAPLPPGVIVAIDDDRLRVDPLPLVGGKLVRARLATGWDVDLASGAVAERPLVGPGQSWSEADSPWACAISYPHADAIRLSRGNRDFWLAWPAPRAAWWADRTLIVNTTDGQVVAFADLASLLEQMTQ